MATNDKTFLEDGLSNAEILKNVKYIREFMEKRDSMNTENKVKFLQGQLSAFYERYPMLFDMATRDDFNFENLNFFLRMREKIIDDKMTAEEASKQVGKIWFDKYVDLSKCKTKE